MKILKKKINLQSIDMQINNIIEYNYITKKLYCLKMTGFFNKLKLS